MKRLSIIFGFVLLIVTIPSLAWQEGIDPPPEIEVAFDALEARIDEPVNFDTITAFQWEERNFPDASLGCPRPGQMYAQVVTAGYKFLLTYEDITYDYRVPTGGESAILCDSFPAQPIGPVDTPTPPTETEPGSPCGAYYEVTAGDTLVEIADRCETTVDALMAINPDIEDPSLIYAGQRLAIPSMVSPYNVSIAPDSGPPGTIITLTATGFPPGARVEVGLGRFRSEYDVYAVREIGDNGTLTTALAIPEDADIGEQWVGVVALGVEEVISEVFLVTDVQVTPTLGESEMVEQAQIYLVALGDAGRSGMAIGCNDSLVPVTVNIEPTIIPLDAALEELLAVDSRTYGQSGLYNALYRSDLIVDGVVIENGEALIELSGEIITGGFCDEPRIEQQLWQTALQYETVDSVTIYVNGKPLNEIFSVQ